MKLPGLGRAGGDRLEEFHRRAASVRAVLDELRPYLADVDRKATPAARAFMGPYSALVAHDAAVDRLDRRSDISSPSGRSWAPSKRARRN